jgi:D-xylose transport system permease protein
MSATTKDPQLSPESPLRSGGHWNPRRILRGDISALPAVLGLVVIWAAFQSLNPNFLTSRNLTNLTLQIAAMATISAGIVLVLLLGEIDLSVGAVSGLCAAVMAVLNVKLGLPGAIAIGAGLLAGTGIGLLQGLWITRARVPSFIVTLAGLLIWQGALLYVLGDTGTVNLTDGQITGLAGTFLPTLIAQLLALGSVVVYVVDAYFVRRRRMRAGLDVRSAEVTAGRIVAVAAIILLTVTVLSADRGVPLAVVVVLAIIVLLNFITKRTVLGRHLFAVGGNSEAARRAGIRVNRVRITVFAMTSTLAACGGILAASRLFAVNQSSGSGDVLLNAIAAAVIGGTSLFGGRGTIWSAVLGALVIGSISNGMDLLAFSSSAKFVISGMVLLVAVTIDAVSRRSSLWPGDL